MSVQERAGVSQYDPSALSQDTFVQGEAGDVLRLPIANLQNPFLEHTDRTWPPPETHDPLDRLLSQLPHIDKVEKLQTEKLFEVVKEKPYALDLGDELRKVQKLISEGRNPECYWEFFESQAEYFANESYAKLGAVEYVHELVNDHGRVKMWIKPMGKGAYESYKDAADKVAPTESLMWYKTRSQIEADAIHTWEDLLAQHQGNAAFVDISPAPFDVPEVYLDGTMFGNHSFIRLHQLVYDEETGVPYVFSRAHRTHLPPEELEVMNTKLTGEKTPWQNLLGNMNVLKADLPLVNIMGRKTDIRDMDVAVAVERMISGLEEQSGISEPVSSTRHTKEEMKYHYRLIKPALKAVFDEMVHGPRDGESQDAFMKKLVQGFQTWEKMLVGRLNGEWGQIEAGMDSGANQPNVDNTQKLQEMYYFYQQQEYRPQANGCGTGSGASGLDERSGMFSPSDSFVLTSSQPVLSGIMNSLGLNLAMEQKKYKFDNEGTCNECKKSHKIVGLLGPCLVCRGCQADFDSGKKK